MGWDETTITPQTQLGVTAHVWGAHGGERGGQGQMGDTQLCRAPSTQFQVPAEWDEHQTFSMQQDQVFLWGSWYSWRLRVGGIWCPL